MYNQEEFQAEVSRLKADRKKLMTQIGRTQKKLVKLTMFRNPEKKQEVIELRDLKKSLKTQLVDCIKELDTLYGRN